MEGTESAHPSAVSPRCTYDGYREGLRKLVRMDYRVEFDRARSIGDLQCRIEFITAVLDEGEERAARSMLELEVEYGREWIEVHGGPPPEDPVWESHGAEASLRELLAQTMQRLEGQPHHELPIIDRQAEGGGARTQPKDRGMTEAVRELLADKFPGLKKLETVPNATVDQIVAELMTRGFLLEARHPDLEVRRILSRLDYAKPRTL